MSFEIFILIFVFLKERTFLFRGPQNFKHVMNLIFIIRQFNNGWKRWLPTLACFCLHAYPQFLCFHCDSLDKCFSEFQNIFCMFHFHITKIHGYITSFIFYFWNLWRSVKLLNWYMHLYNCIPWNPTLNISTNQEWILWNNFNRL